MVNMPAQTPGGSQNLISLGYNAPSHTYPVGYSQTLAKRSTFRRLHDFLMKQGSNEKRR